MSESSTVEASRAGRPWRRRRAWVAGLLSTLCPGLGHLYAGRPALAVLVLFSVPVVLGGLLIVGAFVPGILVTCGLLAVVLYPVIWVSQVVSAVRQARAAGERPRLAWYHRAGVYLAFFVLSAGVSNLLGRPIRAWVIEPFRVPSASMMPTLLPGDMVYVVKAGPAARWGRGDLVVYPAPESSDDGSGFGFGPPVFLKRLIALGGDVVEVEGREVRVNGTPYTQTPCAVPELTYPEVGLDSGSVGTRRGACSVERTTDGRSYSVLHHPELDSGRSPYGPLKLGPAEAFVLGDHRDDSLDSRVTGPVPQSTVRGRAAVIWFSYSPDDGVRWARIGQRL